MNWGAAILLLAGAGIAVVGITKSQQSVCQAISGSNCSWLPVPPGSTEGEQLNTTNQTQNAQTSAIDNIINSCKSNPSCLNYMTLASNDANQSGIDTTDFVRQIADESAFNPNAKSPAGAEGIAQFMPSTAATLGINPYNPTQSLQAAANLMGGYETYWQNTLQNAPNGTVSGAINAIQNNEVEQLALSSYNYGFGGTQGLYKQYGPNWLQHAPQQTQNYVVSIMGS